MVIKNRQLDDLRMQRILLDVTILNGMGDTEGIDLAGGTLCGIIMPTAWTAANLTFRVSSDGTNWFPLYQSDGTEYTATAAASRGIILDPSDMAAWRYLMIRSGTNATPVNQAADRVLTLMIRPV